MKFASYEQVPADVQDKLLEEPIPTPTRSKSADFYKKGLSMCITTTLFYVAVYAEIAKNHSFER